MERFVVHRFNKGVVQQAKKDVIHETIIYDTDESSRMVSVIYLNGNVAMLCVTNSFSVHGIWCSCSDGNVSITLACDTSGTKVLDV